MKKITHIGLDMDLTLIRYNRVAFENLTHKETIKGLVEKRNYPKEILSLKPDFSRAIRGLVLDKKNGNLLKISRFGAIRLAYHGLSPLNFQEKKEVYQSQYISLGDTNYEVIDTDFSVTLSVLFAQLVTQKDTVLKDSLPDYETIAQDIIETLDEAHSKGDLKKKVVSSLKDYILRDPEIVEGLERYVLHNKKVFIVTNSLPEYTIELLDFAIQPYLKNFKHWRDLFHVVISHAQKPSFFYERNDFVKYDISTGERTPVKEKIEPHNLYVGGSAQTFTEKMGTEPHQMLYIGDHIYSDVVRIKKDSSWRTALVIEELFEELGKYEKFSPVQQKINHLMSQKIPLETKIDTLASKDIESNSRNNKNEIDKLLVEIKGIDSEIKPLIEEGFRVFNPYWGEIFRTGMEETFFTNQIERFACVYMSQLKDFLKTSPRTYFRTQKRLMPHERNLFNF